MSASARSPDRAGGRVARRWLAASLPGSLVFVGPEREIEVTVDADADAALAALVPAVDRAALAAALVAAPAEIDELLASLSGAGAIDVREPRSEDGEVTDGAIPLVAALARTRRGESLTAAGRVLVVTADELLVLPAATPAEQERLTLHSFVGSISPDLRLRAYCRVASEGTSSVAGDLPSAEDVDAVLAQLDPDDPRVHAVVLPGGTPASVLPDRVKHLGCEESHRLGPLSEVAPLARASDRDRSDLHVYVARYAVANLRFPEDADRRLGGGRARDPGLAELIARAEAAERYGSGDLGPHDLVRALADDLDAPSVTPDRIFRANERQAVEGGHGLVPYDPAVARLWVRGRTTAGESRWVPADAVFYPFHDPRLGGRTLPTGSSGSAAHTTLAEARSRALCEVIERDAFMWTWVQRVERETIARRSLPEELQRRAADVEGGELRVAFVNLTLDLWPVVACVLRSRERMALAAACDLAPADAAERAFNEAVGLLEVIERGRLAAVAPAEVRTPEQHAALHLDPGRIERDRFLFGSDDEVGLDETVPAGAELEELVARVADPITVDLTSPATAPFAVARVIVPDLVPISFGYDREPLGMPRLAEPKRAHDGRILGSLLDLRDAGPLDPHPFA